MPGSYMQLSLVFLFVLVFVLKCILTRRKGIHVFLTLDRRKPRKQRFFEVLPIILFSFLILGVLREILRSTPSNFLFHDIGLPGWINGAGKFFGFASLVFLVAGYWQLGDNWRMGTGEEERTRLVVNGIFSMTRNPVYLFFIIFSLAFFLVRGSLFYALIFILVTLSLHRVILYEERSLEKAFREQYRDYRKRVPRYLFR